MTYNNPEVTVLGETTHVIQGQKMINLEPFPNQGLKDIVADSELDD